MPLIDLQHVTVDFGGLRALDDLSLRVEPGERVAVIGPSGAGKSTLLALMTGMIKPTSGEVQLIEGRRIAFIPQQHQLQGRLRVVHNVNAGRLGDWSTARALLSLISPREVDEARQVLAVLGIAEKLHERTDRLSGGEQQRVAIARAVRQNPTLILADEPTASLDPRLAEEVMELLVGIGGGEGRTLIVSQHDVGLALSTCDRVVALRGGRVVFDGPVGSITDGAIGALYAAQRR